MAISVTAIANGLRRTERLVGMHFFNPVPPMKLVEVVPGLQTAPAVAAAIFELNQAWCKAPVHARSTPGFIVNRIAQPCHAETLALLLEQATTPAVLDACLRGAGFRARPCELMDLTGHDTNFAVTNLVFEAKFFDKRFVPSLVQREMVDGNLLGRKSGRGSYAYPEGVPALPVMVHEAPATAREVTVHRNGAIADFLEQAAVAALAPQGWGPARERNSGWTGVAIDGARLQRGLAHAVAGLARGAGLHAAAAGRHTGAGGGAHRGNAGQRRRRCGAARRVQRSRRRRGDEARREQPGRPIGKAVLLGGTGRGPVFEALAATYRGERYCVSPGLRRRPHAA